MKKVLLNSLLFILSLLISLIILETLLRYNTPYDLALSKERRSYFETFEVTSEGKRKLKSNYNSIVYGRNGIKFKHATNKHGLRDETHNYINNKKNKRILVLGDSFAYGYGVNNGNTFSDILEKKFKYDNSNIEVINSGVSGWGGAEQLNFLENTGLKYNPDAIVLAYYLNDALDARYNIEGKKNSIVKYYDKKNAVKKIIKQSPKMYLDYVLQDKTFFYPFLVKWFQAFSEYRESYFYDIVGKNIRPNYDISYASKGISLIDFSKEIPRDGSLEAFELFNLTKNQFQLKVWRENSNSEFIEVGGSPLFNLSIGKNTYKLKEVINVKKGDFIGYYASKAELANQSTSLAKKIYFNGKVNKLSKNNYSDNYGNYSLRAFMRKESDNESLSKTESNGLNESSVTKSIKKTLIENYIKTFNNPILAYYDNEIQSYECDKSLNFITFYCSTKNKNYLNMIDESFKYIDEIATISKVNNIEFIVVYLPSIYEFILKKTNLEGFDSEIPYSYLAKKMKNKNIMSFKLKLNTNQNIFIPDTHYNNLGHKITAEEIHKYISNNSSLLR